MQINRRLSSSTVLLLSSALLACGPAPSEPAASAPAKARPSGDHTLEAALRDPDPYARARELGALLPTLDASAVSDVKDVLAKHRLDLGGVELELLVRFWASQEPAEATEWAFKQASPLYQLALARTAIESWAEQDPGAAAAAVNSATAESTAEVARMAEMALVRGWFLTDRPGLERFIYDLGTGVKRQRALYAYVLSLAAADGSEAAIQWGEAIPENDVRYKREAYRQVLSALAWADMPAAVRFCDANCDGPFGTALRNVLVRTRLRNGEYGGDVVSWVGEAPETSEALLASKRQTLWVSYATWAYRDRDAAMAWVQQQAEAPPEKRPHWLPWLYGEYARLLAADSPAEAIPWAEQMEDDAERRLSLIRIARAWLGRDPAAAEAWLAKSSLSELERKQARDTEAPTNLPKHPQAR